VDSTLGRKSCRSRFKLAGATSRYREPKALGTGASTTNPTTIMNRRYNRSIFSCPELPLRTVLLAAAEMFVVRGGKGRPDGLR
jgi:hypothetical protein